jgi:hypothetical protein
LAPRNIHSSTLALLQLSKATHLQYAEESRSTKRESAGQPAEQQGLAPLGRHCAMPSRRRRGGGQVPAKERDQILVSQYAARCRQEQEI